MFDWTDDRIDRLRAMWKDGHRSTDIEREFGDGCTRNAVIGKLGRLGLLGGTRPVSTPPAMSPEPAPTGFPAVRPPPALALNFSPAPKREQRPGVSLSNAVRKLQADADRAAERAVRLEGMRKENEAAERRFTPIEGGKTLLEIRTHECRWPHGDPTDIEAFRFCGEATDGTGPYCAAHAALALNPAFRRHRKAVDA